MDLEDLLSAADPSRNLNDAGLRRSLDELVLSARPTPRTIRRTLRWGAVGAVAMLSAGGAAAASGHLPFGWQTASHHRCVIQSVAVDRAGVSNENGAAFGQMTEAQIQAAVLEATNYLDSYDFSKVDVPGAIEAWKAREAAANPSTSGTDGAPAVTGDLLEISALELKAVDDLKAYLESRGVRWEVVQPVIAFAGQAGSDGVFRCAG